MAVYVDPLKTYGGRWWCHLMVHASESLEALHSLAAELGVKQYRFQRRPNFPHYDLGPRLRDAAVRAGAVEVDSQTMVRLCRR